MSCGEVNDPWVEQQLSAFDRVAESSYVSAGRIAPQNRPDNTPAKYRICQCAYESFFLLMP